MHIHINYNIFLKKIGKKFVSEHSDIDYTHINSYKDNKLICQNVISKLGDGVESLEINLI